MQSLALRITVAAGLLWSCGPATAETSPARHVTFKLTYANGDLVWIGDPLSPASHVYPREGARPLAADVEVRTRIASEQHPYRRYVTESRIENDAPRRVYAFTDQGERCIGAVGDDGRFAENESYAALREQLPTWPTAAATLKYDAGANRLYVEVDAPGSTITESSDFLPLDLRDSRGMAVGQGYAVVCSPAPRGGEPIEVELRLDAGAGAEPLVLARAQAPRILRRADVRLGSFDAVQGSYLPEAAYRPYEQASHGAAASITFDVPGAWAPLLDSNAETLTLTAPVEARSPSAPATIAIDGRFDDWRNVAGVDDPRGDLAPYLDYVPDVDLLEFKVASDEQHLFLYARVAGQVGRCHPQGGRSYFYAYLDVDRNPTTGFLPSRDDNCYFGVDIGDDCEVQFEFVDNRLRKTFYGFCGLGGDDDVLRRQVTLGPSQYGRLNPDGTEREHYKSEYTFRDGRTEITEDLKLGTSDTIRVAVSPDGSEVEIASSYDGFLRDRAGRPIVAPGQEIDLAAGMECDSKAFPEKSRWGADSTPAIRGQRLGAKR